VTTIRIVDVTDEEAFALVPPCADPAFDHRTCDYWEDAVGGSRAHREAWLQPRQSEGSPAGRPAPQVYNPFLEEAAALKPAFNPFAPPPRRIEGPGAAAPRKLGLLARGLGVFGSYARVLLVDDRAVAYCQFGPLSAYPRALRLRDLYPQLPPSPLPAVITCIATTREARRRGHALALVADVCEDLARRGFVAVETYPEVGARADATSAATPRFWERAGFVMAVADERFPVMRRGL
jgi:GNAT superfamily N-acetyltransferase